MVIYFYNCSTLWHHFKWRRTLVCHNLSWLFAVPLKVRTSSATLTSSSCLETVLNRFQFNLGHSKWRHNLLGSLSSKHQAWNKNLHVDRGDVGIYFLAYSTSLSCCCCRRATVGNVVHFKFTLTKNTVVVVLVGKALFSYPNNFTISNRK